jgi:hypothetical protein
MSAGSTYKRTGSTYKRTGPADKRAGSKPSGSGSRPQLLGDAGRGKIITALRIFFNFLALNIALLAVSLPIVTVPIALNAATIALDRWRDGEDRVVREFLHALRSCSLLRTTLAIGTPLAVIVIAAEEVHHFARGGPFVNWACLGMGAAALLVSLTSLGYVIVVWAARPFVPTPDLWSFCARLALQNFFVTGPLFVVEIAGAALVALLDPALLIIGLPLGFCPC